MKNMWFAAAVFATALASSANASDIESAGDKANSVEKTSTEVTSEANTKRSNITYVGLDLFTGESKITGKAFGSSVSETFDRNGFRLKLGTKRNDGLAFEGYFEIEDYDAFENNIVTFGGNLKYSGGNLGETQPFFKLGVMAGSTELESDAFIQYEEDSLSYVAFLAGIGLERQVSDKVSLHLGVDVAKRYWQEIEFYDGFNRVLFKQDDTPVSAYVGVHVSL